MTGRKNSFSVVDVDLSPFWEAIHIPALILRGEVSDILDRKTVAAMQALTRRPKALRSKAAAMRQR